MPITSRLMPRDGIDSTCNRFYQFVVRSAVCPLARCVLLTALGSHDGCPSSERSSSGPWSESIFASPVISLRHGRGDSSPRLLSLRGLPGHRLPSLSVCWAHSIAGLIVRLAWHLCVPFFRGRVDCSPCRGWGGRVIDVWPGGVLTVPLKCVAFGGMPTPFRFSK